MEKKELRVGARRGRGEVDSVFFLKFPLTKNGQMIQAQCCSWRMSKLFQFRPSPLPPPRSTPLLPPLKVLRHYRVQQTHRYTQTHTCTHTHRQYTQHPLIALPLLPPPLPRRGMWWGGWWWLERLREWRTRSLMFRGYVCDGEGGCGSGARVYWCFVGTYVMGRVVVAGALLQCVATCCSVLWELRTCLLMFRGYVPWSYLANCARGLCVCVHGVECMRMSSTCYTYIYIYTCMHVCIHIYICMYVCIYIHIHMYVCTYMCVYIRVYIYIYMYVHIYTYIYMHVCTYILYIYVCIYIYMHIHVYTYTHICIYTYSYTYIYTYIIHI